MIYDIESYGNLFNMAILHRGTRTRWNFEISHRRNEYPAMVQWFTWASQTGVKMIGFNNLGFDYPVVHLMLTNPGLSPYDIHQFVQTLINVDHNRRFDHIIWERDQIVPQIDLYKIHHFDNPAKATSLKVLEFNMRRRNVLELPYHPDTILTDEQIDHVIRYNHEDVDATAEFADHSTEQIRFREELSVKYSHNYMNFNDTKIGKHYFAAELEKRLPGCCYIPGSRKPRQTQRPQIAKCLSTPGLFG